MAASLPDEVRAGDGERIVAEGPGPCPGRVLIFSRRLTVCDRRGGRIRHDFRYLPVAWSLLPYRSDATDEPREPRGDAGRDGAPRPPALRSSRRTRACSRSSGRACRRPGPSPASAGCSPSGSTPTWSAGASPRASAPCWAAAPRSSTGSTTTPRTCSRWRWRTGPRRRPRAGGRCARSDRARSASPCASGAPSRARTSSPTRAWTSPRALRAHMDAGPRPGHPRGAAAHAGPAHRRARGAHRDRHRLRRARGAARGGPRRPGRDHPRARPALRGGGAAPARGGGAGGPRPHDRRRARARHRAPPGHRGRAGAVPQRRRGDRPAHPRVRRGAAALLDLPVVRRRSPRPGSSPARGSAARCSRSAGPCARATTCTTPSISPRLHGAGPAAGHPGPDGGADPDRRPGRGPALRGQPLGPRLHRPARVGPGAARRAGRHRDPQRPDPRGRADRPRHRGAAGAGAAGEPGPLPVRGARHQRRGVGLGSRQRRAVVERGREHALRLHAGAGRPGRHVVVRDDPPGRSRAREARHPRGGGARGRELERGVSLPPGRRDVRLRLRPGLRAARRGRPAHRA